jgi:NAD(P)-dependent dehydrogenase (short-subunit alcohol dehydrogenase family)
MVALKDILASNSRISSDLPKGLVAVFVGATSGIGEYTLKCFARRASSPRVYIIGRSQSAADRILNECKILNSNGTFEFIRADVGLLKEVDDACRQIREKEESVNILFMTQGSLAAKYGLFQSLDSKSLLV